MSFVLIFASNIPSEILVNSLFAVPKVVIQLIKEYSTVRLQFGNISL